MSHPNRPLTSQLRASNVHGSVGQSPALVARVNEKKIELENLKELRDLSAGLAGQMQMLEDKLATLASGTEVKITKPQDTDDTAANAVDGKEAAQVPLPQTLVRIPAQSSQPSTTQPSAPEASE
ncbi:MAG: hypothetical protein M1838_006170 [Thelocarpon superellum]|nr:MAG: hypothetical protein M1838_006170 [Thelocarpon superellum]